MLIVVRAPLRISFMGGGTDLPEFYAHYPGRVLSAAIDKYIYIALKPTDLVRKFIVKYQKTEVADRPEDIEHPVIRAALTRSHPRQGIEIASFADIPAKTGLGSSSSFTVALLIGLATYRTEALSPREAAEAAADLEIKVLKEPIGKQDHYAAAFGGCNSFTFFKDEPVRVDPVSLPEEKRVHIESHLLLFFTGLMRSAGSVLAEQRARIGEHMETYRRLADAVPAFHKLFVAGEVEAMGEMLHESWIRKRGLASTISNRVLDTFYGVATAAGAWGGKVLGAGGGGCLLFFAPPERHREVRSALAVAARAEHLADFQEISFTLRGERAEVLLPASAPRSIGSVETKEQQA